MLNKAIIDLAKLKRNALNVKALIPEHTKFCAVVKADAYGHGAPAVASALYPLVDCFAVALVEEGVELRLCGIDKEILVLTPVYPIDAQSIVRFDLTATVSSEKDVQALYYQAKAQGKTVSVHVKYNTGMNRQGVDDLKELEQILLKARQSRLIKVDGIYSHFANPSDKKRRRAAENKFLLANNLVKRYNNKAICHISASGGLLKGAYYDMVRVGILLYGYKPFPFKGVSVEPIMKVYAPVLQNRRVKKGEFALYGNKSAKEDLQFSLVRFGYADGLIKNIRSIFNNRCMDVSAALNAKAQDGMALIMDDAEMLAKEYKTISYEILTAAAKRAQKIYVSTEE